MNGESLLSVDLVNAVGESLSRNEGDKKDFKRIVDSVFLDYASGLGLARETTIDKLKLHLSKFYVAMMSLTKSLGFDYSRIFCTYSFVEDGFFSQISVTEQDSIICPISGYDFQSMNIVSDICSLYEPNLLKHLRFAENEVSTPAIEKYRLVVIAYPNIACVFGVNRWYEKKSQLCKCFDEICRWFTRFYVDYDNRVTIFLQSRFSQTLHLYKHEMSHLALRLQHKAEQLHDLNHFHTMPYDKQNLITEDVISITRSMQRMTRSVGLIMNEDNPNGTWQRKIGYLHVLGELNKWRSTYRLELKTRCQSIRVKEYGAGGYFYTEDPELLSIILFNLIDNAVKYAFWGTQILVEVYDTEIKITDYGTGIDPNEKQKIFDLYFRGENAQICSVGDGVGLFTAKSIAKKLGLQLTVESNIAFPFDVGLFAEMLHVNKNSNITSDISTRYASYMKKFSKIMNRLNDVDINYDEVSYDIEGQDISAIERKTYEVCFTIAKH